MLGKPIALFELLGFKVKMDLSWLFISLLIAWSLAQGYFPEVLKGRSASTYWAMGIAGVAGLFASLVLHELSHSIVARRFGLQIQGITLFVFGGVAEMETEPAEPKAELLMAIAGPIFSGLLAAGFLGGAAIAEAQGLSEPVVAVMRYLALINGVLAGFNLMPAFPLDGGRVLRAALWRWKGDVHRATTIASRLGSAFGLALIAFSVFNILEGNFIGAIWWFLIGIFIRQASAQSLQQMLLQRTLKGRRVREFMSSTPVVVTPDIAVRELVDAFVYRHGFDFFPVVDGSRLSGCVGTAQIRALPRERWGETFVADIMLPCSKDNTIDADEDATRALALMTRTGNSRLMVTKSGSLAGVITLKDLLKLIALKLELESEW
jgi:Zn-dependent protease/CBS domain-containing protein